MAQATYGTGKLRLHFSMGKTLEPGSEQHYHAGRLGQRAEAMHKPLLIRVEWDDEARVWSAASDDVPGLATEADTVEALNLKLREMIPELLVLNGIAVADDIAYELLIRRLDSVRADAA